MRLQKIIQVVSLSLTLLSLSLNVVLWRQLHVKQTSAVFHVKEELETLPPEQLSPDEFPSQTITSSTSPNLDLDPLLYLFPPDLVRPKQRSINQTSSTTDSDRFFQVVKHISGPQTVTYSPPDKTYNVTFDIPEGVVLRPFKWYIPENVLKENGECEKLDYGILEVPPIPEAVLTSSWWPRLEAPFSGGVWAPEECQPRDRVAILVPYRARVHNLHVFLPYMHFYLQQQGIEYGIYLIEQADERPFNRGKLLNIGFIISQLLYEQYSCYLLHDIDKLPEDTRHSYTCHQLRRPMHMMSLKRASLITSVEMWHEVQRYISNSTQPLPLNITTPYMSGRTYKGYFGGVSAVKREHYLRINGMTNSFWGWGGEDDDLYLRFVVRSLRPSYPRDSAQSPAKYLVLFHPSDAHYSHRTMPKLEVVRHRMLNNGLHSLHFQLVNIVYRPWYTHIIVKL